ncbi:hypothetical protein [Thalassospira profundimaris]|uniref:Solute-binding protein family 3/N-terminal domain-containing protein n=1 Tax=Thalassospira profundimaris TaxID=502049 RepID=A0A367X5T4_9PROT|nr:hypothetical protein [Thalassospira profundimaris]RCK49038.1 hypothetical protein TH30_01530 [Thalassospira profundimaris]
MTSNDRKIRHFKVSGWIGMLCLVVAVFCFDIKTVRADHGEHSLRIVVADDVLVDYEKFRDGRDPLAITSFDGPHSRRDVVEVVLIQQALKKGGWRGAINLIAGGNYARMMQMIADGEADLTGSSTWLRDIEHKGDRISPSGAVIPNGRFEAGFYMRADSPNRSKIRSLRSLQRLRGVSNRTWKPDWQALGKLGLVDLLHVPNWELMVQFVAEGRADFLLAPFQPGPKMELVVNDVHLLPIEGYKIALDGSRHYAVTRVTPYSHDLIVAIDQGLLELQKIGRIDQAYRQSGFFHPAVKNWTMIGSDGFGQSGNSMENQIFSLRDVTGRLYPEARF